MSTAIDFWGFYNSNGNANSLVPAYRDCGGAEYKYLNNTADRWTDPDKVKNGSLVRIDYPTGGYTTFEYEAHVVAKLGVCNTPNGDTKVGGLRIKKINSYANSQLAFSKTYSYTKPNSTASSGLLINDLNFVSKSIYHIDPVAPGWPDLYPEKACTVDCNRIIVFSENSSLLPTKDNHHVGYSNVIETFKGSTEFEFKNVKGRSLSNGELKKTTLKDEAGNTAKIVDYNYASDAGEVRRKDEINAVIISPRQIQDNRKGCVYLHRINLWRGSYTMKVLIFVDVFSVMSMGTKTSNMMLFPIPSITTGPTPNQSPKLSISSKTETPSQLSPLRK